MEVVYIPQRILGLLYRDVHHSDFLKLKVCDYGCSCKHNSISSNYFDGQKVNTISRSLSNPEDTKVAGYKLTNQGCYKYSCNQTDKYLSSRDS